MSINEIRLFQCILKTMSGYMASKLKHLYVVNYASSRKNTHNALTKVSKTGGYLIDSTRVYNEMVSNGI